jgi:hypothetical protein
MQYKVLKYFNLFFDKEFVVSYLLIFLFLKKSKIKNDLGVTTVKNGGQAIRCNLFLGLKDLKIQRLKD